MSAQAQFAWGLLLPVLAFGDEALDIWFLASSWNEFVYEQLKWTCIIHLIIVLSVQFIHGFIRIKKTERGHQFIGFSTFWGVLCMLNLNESYMYWQKKQCCFCGCCGGEWRDFKFEEQCQEILKWNQFIHIFGQDLPQIILQIVHLATYIQLHKTTSDQFLNVLSIFFSGMFLLFGSIKFICSKFCYPKNCDCCNYSLLDIFFGRCLKNKPYKPPNKEISMTQIARYL